MSRQSSALAAGVLWFAGVAPAVAAADLTPENFARLAAAEVVVPENFEALRAQIKPQPGESRWLEIPWLLDLHEARRQAAAEGKPLFVYSGGGATGIGPC